MVVSAYFFGVTDASIYPATGPGPNTTLRSLLSESELAFRFIRTQTMNNTPECGRRALIAGLGIGGMLTALRGCARSGGRR
jgi:hypothetical protein